MRFTSKKTIERNKAKLLGANMQGANLQNANLQNANMQGADMRYADMRYADMQGADMRDANMRYADMRGANLANCAMHHIDARDLMISEDAEILFRMDCCVWPVTVWHNVVHIGCEEFSFEDILKMTEKMAEEIHEGAGKRWKRFGKTLKSAIRDIIAAEKLIAKAKESAK